jgi:hypothetical protein
MPHWAQRPQGVQPRAVLPQALPVASQPDPWAGWRALRDEWESQRAQPGPQVSLPAAPLPEPQQAVLVQPAQRSEQLPPELSASQSASRARQVSLQAQR